MHEDKIEKLLGIDPLKLAEDCTGKSYKEDPVTSLMGLTLLQELSKQKEMVLQAADDTTLRTRTEDYLRIAKSIGFEIVYKNTFVGHSGLETHYVMFDKRGILLSFDTYNSFGNGESAVNGGHYYYNLELNDYKNPEWYKHISSGGLCKDESRDVWIGQHDCREGLRYHIKMLESVGRFLNPWIESPFLWLLNYMDTKKENYDYQEINSKVISMLPKNVQDCIKIKGDDTK